MRSARRIFVRLNHLSAQSTFLSVLDHQRQFADVTTAHGASDFNKNFLVRFSLFARQ